MILRPDKSKVIIFLIAKIPEIFLNCVFLFCHLAVNDFVFACIGGNMELTLVLMIPELKSRVK